MYPQNSYGAPAPAAVGSEHLLAGAMGVWGPILVLIIILLVVWSVAWKGLALWKSARLGSKVWFVVLLVVNTLGILDILYLYVFSKKSAPVVAVGNNGADAADGSAGTE